MIDEAKTHPLLTLETLKMMERRIENRRTTIEDCEIIDHYLESKGWLGVLLQDFKCEGIYSFEEFIELHHSRSRDKKSMVARASGILLGNIHYLMELVDDGEKIY